MHDSATANVRDLVREHYAKVAASSGPGCAPGCCGGSVSGSAELGYSKAELESAPEGADLGLGCGNPQTIAALQPGETVLDLGSGAGFDCFLAARQVGPSGHVIGVDMTPAMLTKARENARRAAVDNVEFRLGEIEHLPLESTSVDVIISNCVLNLSPSKAEVIREAFRVLRPGGRVAISDVVATADIPAQFRNAEAALTGCIGGAERVERIEHMLSEAGFSEVEIQIRPQSRQFIKDWMPGSGIERYIASAAIYAKKPARAQACCGVTCCVEGASAE